MKKIYVCSLAEFEQMYYETNASHILSIISPNMHINSPANILQKNHLIIRFNDILVPTKGMIAPDSHHVYLLINFIKIWYKQELASPIIIHCLAGISRSTAAAFIAACALMPHIDENEIALNLRKQSPTASPNSHLVYLADCKLKRSGKMVNAIKMIGKGIEQDQSNKYPLFFNITS